MKHGIVLLIVSIVLLVLGLGGCRAKKSVSISEDRVNITERVEVVKDSVRTEDKSETNISTKTDEKENTYVRITEYDSTGIVKKVHEEWKERQTTNEEKTEKKEETVTEAVTKSEIIETDSTSSVVKQDSKLETDSRPIQGFEWFWIIIAISTAIILTTYFIVIKKYGNHNTKA